MATCCLESICRVICEATFEPVLICDDWRPLACNQRLLEVFRYTSEEQVTRQPLKEFIGKHFTPKEVLCDGVKRPAKVLELTYALVASSDMSERMAIVKAKEWRFGERIYFTVSVRDVPILKFAKKEFLPMDNMQVGKEEDKELITNEIEDKQDIENLERNSESQEEGLEFEEGINFDEPKLESRLLAEFALLADAIPVMVWICGREGEIYYANSRVKETWGIDVLHESWDQNVHPEDWEQFIPIWQNANKHKIPYKMEARYRNKNNMKGDDSDWRWHILQSIPVFREGKLKRWVLTAVDVHDWKMAEAEKQLLLASEQMAMESSRLKSAFLSMMSHEIRTPLFGIVGNTCLLKETNLNFDQKSFIENIDGSARLMMSVIQDILDFSRIEANKLNLNPTTFSLNQFLLKISRMISNSAQRKKLKFQMILPNRDYIIHCDIQRLHQIIINLASNAIKFTHEGQVIIKINSEEFDKKEIHLRLEFIDTGIGMTTEVSNKLFSPWTQADSTNRRLYGGSGLGLAITKSLVDMMMGRIGLVTKLGEGSTFWVELNVMKGDPSLVEADIPLSPDSPMNSSKLEFYDLIEAGKSIENFIKSEEPLIKLPKNKKPKLKPLKRKTPNSSDDLNDNNVSLNNKSNSISIQSFPPNKKFQVLLAEDNPINQAILVRFLSKMGCIECTLKSDGLLALECYNSYPKGYFDLILLDQSMPKMDGDQVAKLIREKDKQQIIISVSANTLLSDRSHFLEIGMNDHISKPVTFGAFRDTVSRWLLVVAKRLKGDKNLPNSNKNNGNDQNNSKERILTDDNIEIQKDLKF